MVALKKDLELRFESNAHSHIKSAFLTLTKSAKLPGYFQITEFYCDNKTFWAAADKQVDNFFKALEQYNSIKFIKIDNSIINTFNQEF
jgi:hypothetical protein